MSLNLLGSLKKNLPQTHSAVLALYPANPIPQGFKYPIGRHSLAVFDITKLDDAHKSMKEGVEKIPSFKALFSNDELSLLEKSSAIAECYGLVRKTLNHEIQENKTEIQGKFVAIDPSIRNVLAGKIYHLSKDPHKGGENWGVLHASDDLSCLRDALLDLGQGYVKVCGEKTHKWAIQTFQNLSQAEKNCVYGAVYRLAKCPSTQDPKWGENNVANDIPRLITAMHIEGVVDGGPSASSEYDKSWETYAKEPSKYYEISGKNLERGEISFINGMALKFDSARWDAERIAKAHTQGHALHCVYGATYDNYDLPSCVYGQMKIALPQARLLIKRWGDFFARSAPEEKYLQICTSRGAIDVVAALDKLPQEQRMRVIVIAIAPGYIVESSFCYKAINLVIKSDNVPWLAPNSTLIGKANEVKILPDHHNGDNSHDPHGPSYKDAVQPLVDEYIRTNDITIK